VDNKEKNRLQRLIALLSVGICDALRDGVISHDEAERLLFSPHSSRWCNYIGMEKLLVSLLHDGTELDTIDRLVGSDEWNSTIERLRANAYSVLTKTEESDSQLDTWLDKIGDDS
jgi:hypothetical protein